MPSLPAPVRLAIFARYPRPGEAKTRLIPALGADGAALVYRRLLERTVTAARQSGLRFELRVTGAAPARFHEWLGDDLVIVPQGGGDLGERLMRAAAPGIVIGSDAPALTPQLLQAAALALETAPAVIGPAHDGGYYLLGFNAPVPFAFADMEWSTSGVFQETLRRLEANGMAPHFLPPLSDIDTMDDLANWPELLP